MPEQQGELEAKIAGQEVSIKSDALNSLNTIATVVILIVVCGLGVLFYQHNNDSHAMQQQFIDVIKDETAAIRDQTKELRMANCMAQTKGDSSLCQRI